MSKNKAFLETLIVSLIIPVIMFGATVYALTRIFSGLYIVSIVFIFMVILYSTVVFDRHKELGGLFVFLTAVFSTILQFITSTFLLVLFMQDKSFNSGEGHPNGDAILLLVILVLQPVLINIGAFIIWLIKKIVWLFRKD